MHRTIGALLSLLTLSGALYATTPKAQNDTLQPAQNKGAPKKATPKEDKKLTAAEQKTYKAALKEGRTNHTKKKYKDAIASFEKALAVNPDDPRAMSELGYAAYFDKDYAKAEEFTRKAIDRSSDPDIRGSSLYNLGLIQEAQGKNADAIASYTQSLEARPNRVVREALAKLDASAAARFDPFNPIALNGPYKTLDDWCKVALADQSFIEANGCFTKADNIEGLPELLKGVKASAPYKEVSVVGAYHAMYQEEGKPAEFQGLGEVLYQLALKTDKGWYVVPNGLYVYNPGAFGIFQSFVPTSIEIKDAIPGGQPEVLFSYEYQTSDHDMAGAILYYANTKETVICGVGASGAPSCTNPIVTQSTDGVDTSLWDTADLGPLPEKSSESQWTLSLSFTTDGQIEVKQGTLKGLKALPKEVKAGLGKRVLAFP